MKAAIYNPYLDTFGGGERYTMTVASILRDAGYEVAVEWENKSIKEQLENRFGIDLEDIEFIKDIERGENYDICFWLSDGSIPLLRARKNFLHFQIPFHGVKGKTLLNKMKLFRIAKIICNSKFTKKYIDNEYGVNSLVLYPPVDVAKFKPKRKENIILFVGRFSQLKQAKNQDVLIKVFKRLVNAGVTGWKLVLAGGVEIGAKEYLLYLQKSVGNYPIEIIQSPDFKTLVDLYGKAKIFWSAVGFGVNEEKEPERVEHFGISAIEAMASGCIPVAYNAGGYKEIISNSKNGLLWTKKKELLTMTRDLIKNSRSLVQLARQNKEDVIYFSLERFKKEFLDLLQN